MQGFPEADFRPQEPKLFTELSTGGLRAKSRIESTYFRAAPEGISTPHGKVQCALKLAPRAAPR
jgi:hypothetical protein